MCGVWVTSRIRVYWRLFAYEVVFSRSRVKVEDYKIVCSFSLHAFPWLTLILFLPLGQKKTENFTAHAESSMFTSFDLSSYCGKKKTGCISLSFSLMLCWVNNNDAILKVNTYLEDILCIRKFRPLCSFPLRCVRLGEDPISEATRKQICETRIEDEREYKVFVTVVC